MTKKDFVWVPVTTGTLTPVPPELLQKFDQKRVMAIGHNPTPSGLWMMAIGSGV